MKLKHGLQLGAGIITLGMIVGVGACRPRGNFAQQPAAAPAPAVADQAPVAAAGCTKDEECKGGRICQSGKCVTSVDEELVANIEEGGVSYDALLALSKAKHCVESEGIDEAMKTLAKEPTDDEIESLAERIGVADSDLDQSQLFGEWLLAAYNYKKLCKSDLKARRVAKAAESLAAVVTEDTVEKAVEGYDCTTLSLIHRAEMWPFAQRMSEEVVARKFSDAEITRKLWLDTLKTFGKECKKRLNRRQKIAVDSQIDKLNGIIGLDDSLLVDLRTKLLAAMESADAAEIATLSKAISEREAVLDNRKSRDMEEEMKRLERRRRVAEKRRALAEAKAREAQNKGGSSGGGSAGGGGGGGGSSDVAGDIKKAAKTAKDVKDTVDIARSILPF